MDDINRCIIIFQRQTYRYDFFYVPPNSQKMEAEHSLAQKATRLNTLRLEKEKALTNNYTLQDTISKLK